MIIHCSLFPQNEKEPEGFPPALASALGAAKKNKAGKTSVCPALWCVMFSLRVTYTPTVADGLK